MENKIFEFKKELTILSNKYKLYIDGCGCCGSPYIRNENGEKVDYYLCYNEKKKIYI